MNERDNTRRGGLGPWGRSLAGLLLAAQPTAAVAQEESVVGTLHNLSVSGPGEVRSLTEEQICKFCHIPHNAVVPDPLWGHSLSNAQYEVPEIRTPSGREAAPQPDGASRLCLSCHDGTIALGDIATEPRPIAMAGASRLGPGDRGYLGTDLSGSHPISFVVSAEGLNVEDGDMGVRSSSSISADPDVNLDDAGKMQCTTCHDAHADRYFQPGRVPRFWVKPSVTEVCITCHSPR